MKESESIINNMLLVLQDISARQEQCQMAIVNLAKELSQLKEAAREIQEHQKIVKERSCEDQREEGPENSKR